MDFNLASNPWFMYTFVALLHSFSKQTLLRSLLYNMTHENLFDLSPLYFLRIRRVTWITTHSIAKPNQPNFIIIIEFIWNAVAEKKISHTYARSDFSLFSGLYNKYFRFFSFFNSKKGRKKLLAFQAIILLTYLLVCYTPLTHHQHHYSNLCDKHGKNWHDILSVWL